MTPLDMTVHILGCHFREVIPPTVGPAEGIYRVGSRSIGVVVRVHSDVCPKSTTYSGRDRLILNYTSNSAE